MAVGRSIATAIGLKPIGIARDLAIIAFFGIGAETDVFYACLLALALAQGVVMGTLANLWIPRYSAIPSEHRSAYFVSTVRQSTWLGCAVAGALVCAALTSGYWPNLVGTLSSDFLAVMAFLAPTIPIYLLVGWLGNRYLAEGQVARAQLVFGAPVIAFLMVLVLAGSVSLTGAPSMLPYYYWMAMLGVGAVCYCFYWREWTAKVPAQAASSVRPIRSQEYAVAILETVAFACLQTALILLPTSLLAGSGTISGFVARVYGSLMSLVVSPASQALLYLSANARLRGKAARPTRYLFTFIIAAVALSWALSHLVELLLSAQRLHQPWTGVIPGFLRAYSLHFAAMAAVIVLSRVLAVRAMAMKAAMLLGTIYAMAAAVLLAIHPAEQAVDYVYCAALALSVGALGLAAFYVNSLPKQAS